MEDDDPTRKLQEGAAMFECHVGMAMIVTDPTRPEGVLRNGTASFVDTGSRRLIVTNAHVYQFYQQKRAQVPGTMLAVSVGNAKQPIDITSAKLIDSICQGGVDLATLDFDRTDLIESGGKEFFTPKCWPPPHPQKGDVAFLIGFPELHREPSARGLEARLTPVCDFITSVSDRQLMLVDENLERRVLKANPHLKDFGSLSGMSGCAVFSQTPGEAVWNLAGFMYEASASSNDHHAMICVSHADFITATGMIDRGRMPWL